MDRLRRTLGTPRGRLLKFEARPLSKVLEYDPYSYEIDLDPYPLYRRMRDEAPAYYNPRLDFWALTRFDDCHDALIDWQGYSSAQGTVLELMGNAPMAGSIIIFMDPPKQTRYRNLVSKAFTPGEAIAHVRRAGILLLHPLCGGIPPAVAWEHLELVGKKVLPALRSPR